MSISEGRKILSIKFSDSHYKGVFAARTDRTRICVFLCADFGYPIHCYVVPSIWNTGPYFGEHDSEPLLLQEGRVWHFFVFNFKGTFSLGILVFGKLQEDEKWDAEGKIKYYFDIYVIHFLKIAQRPFGRSITFKTCGGNCERFAEIGWNGGRLWWGKWKWTWKAKDNSKFGKESQENSGDQHSRCCFPTTFFQHARRQWWVEIKLIFWIEGTVDWPINFSSNRFTTKYVNKTFHKSI